MVKRPSYCSSVSVFSDYKSHKVDKPCQQRRVCPGKWEAIALLGCSVLVCILAEKVVLAVELKFPVTCFSSTGVNSCLTGDADSEEPEVEGSG